MKPQTRNALVLVPLGVAAAALLLVPAPSGGTFEVGQEPPGVIKPEPLRMRGFPGAEATINGWIHAEGPRRRRNTSSAGSTTLPMSSASTEGSSSTSFGRSR